MAVRDAVDAIRDHGYPVWVGGHDPAVRELAAAHADGWNQWGGGLRTFRAQAEDLRIAAARATRSRSRGAGSWCWVPPTRRRTTRRPGSRRARGRSSAGPSASPTRLREFADAGAEWIIVGPVDSVEPRERVACSATSSPRSSRPDCECRLLAAAAGERDLLGILEVAVDVLARQGDEQPLGLGRDDAVGGQRRRACVCAGRRPSRVGRPPRARRRSAWACGTSP